MISGPVLLRAFLLGLVLQLTMVALGHSLPAVARLFGVLGLGFSFVAGLAYALWLERPTDLKAALGGAIAGGACALIAISVSVLLGDVLPGVLGFGTPSSTIAGALGGVVGSWIRRPAAQP